MFLFVAHGVMVVDGNGYHFVSLGNVSFDGRARLNSKIAVMIIGDVQWIMIDCHCTCGKLEDRPLRFIVGKGGCK